MEPLLPVETEERSSVSPETGKFYFTFIIAPLRASWQTLSLSDMGAKRCQEEKTCKGWRKPPEHYWDPTTSHWTPLRQETGDTQHHRGLLPPRSQTFKFLSVQDREQEYPHQVQVCTIIALLNSTLHFTFKPLKPLITLYCIYIYI